jgi:hypothetical protein
VDDDGNGYVDDVYGIDTVTTTAIPWTTRAMARTRQGTIAAIGNNNLGVVGVNWNARVLSCKFLDADGSGTDAGAIECFNYIGRDAEPRREHPRDEQQLGRTARIVAAGAALIAAIDAAGPWASSTSSARETTARTTTSARSIPPAIHRRASSPSRRRDRPIDGRSSATTARRPLTWRRLVKTS